MNDERRRDARGSSHANRNYNRWSAQAAARRRRQLEQIGYELKLPDEPQPAPEPQRLLNWTKDGTPIPPKPARREE